VLFRSVRDPRTGKLWVFSRDSGSLRQEIVLPAAPLDNGLAVTKAGVVVALADGRVVNYRSEAADRTQKKGAP